MKYISLFVFGAALTGLATQAAAFRFHQHSRGATLTRSQSRRSHDKRLIHASEEPLGSGEHNPYADYHGPGSAVLNQTERARSEPGVTLELAPDAKETATGGPVGGVPGFDGS